MYLNWSKSSCQVAFGNCRALQNGWASCLKSPNGQGSHVWECLQNHCHFWVTKIATECKVWNMKNSHQQKVPLLSRNIGLGMHMGRILKRRTRATIYRENWSLNPTQVLSTESGIAKATEDSTLTCIWYDFPYFWKQFSRGRFLGWTPINLWDFKISYGESVV